MYSENVIERHLHTVAKALKLKPKRVSIAKAEEWTAHLNSLLKDGRLKRPLRDEERSFISNERLISKLDYRYWAERYSTINLDGSVGLGIGHFHPWESQELTLKVIAAVEEENFASFEEGSPCDGICIVQHKSRQLGATCLARSLMMHRATLWEYTRAMAASVDEPKVHDQLYSRDKVCYDNLPWYLKPRILFDVKNKHLTFDGIHSSIMYQQSNQESGMGQGSQFDISHLTEVASWQNPAVIRYDFIPTIPQSPFAFCILESTANGRGNWWHTFTEEVRRREHRRWHYCFWPWYVNARKYRAKPPPAWKPSELTLLHAKKVYDTSREWVGHDVLLPQEQLYWYESERASAKRLGELNLFLTNYATTPEESFQHSTLSAFSTELLEEMRLQTTVGKSYEFRLEVRQ